MNNQIVLPHKTTCFLAEDKNFLDWSNSVRFHRELFLNNESDSWLLFCDNAYQFSVLFFALLSANKSMVLPQNGTASQLQDALSFVQGVAGTKELEANNIVLFDENGTKEDTEQLTFFTDTKVTLFTSGSTGRAKAINKDFSHLLKEVQQLDDCFGYLNTDSCIVSTVSHQHIYGLLFKVLWPIWSGKNVIFQPYEYPEHLCHDIAKFKINKVSLISSPAHFHRLIKDNVYQSISSNIACMFSSGGPLSLEASLQLANEIKQPPYEIFGSTETGGIAWRQRFSAESQHWNVFQNIQIAADADNECLKIKSPYLPQTDWYLCDDKVNLINANTFELCGRVDRIVKIEEKRVSLDHVQQCLKAINFIDDVHCLTAVNKRGLQVVALIVLKDEAKQALLKSRNLVFNKKIISILQAHLEAVAMPKRFRYIDALPYNSSGKLNKKEMEKLFEK